MCGLEASQNAVSKRSNSFEFIIRPNFSLPGARYEPWLIAADFCRYHVDPGDGLVHHERPWLCHGQEGEAGRQSALSGVSTKCTAYRRMKRRRSLIKKNIRKSGPRPVRTVLQRKMTRLVNNFTLKRTKINGTLFFLNGLQTLTFLGPQSTTNWFYSMYGTVGACM